MADERVTERVVERPTTTVVERRGSGWGVVFAIILIAIIAVAAYILLVDNQNETRGTNAVVGDRKSTRRTPDTHAHLVCLLLPEKKKHSVSSLQHLYTQMTHQ